MKYKALISDFDGTLFSSDGRIPDENSEAINELINAGGKFALCTGRMTASAIVMLEKYPFNRLIAAYNGCEVWDNVNRKSLFKTGLNSDISLRIIDFAIDSGLLAFVYDGAEVFTDEINEFSKFYGKTCKVDVIAADNLKKFVGDRGLITPKVMLAGYPDAIEKGFEEAKKLFGEECEITESYRGMIDFMPKGCDKGLAVKALAKIWGIKPEECVAIGDELNDAPMLKAAGLGVAMKNGREELKAVADRVTEADNDHGGVAETIRKYFL